MSANTSNFSGDIPKYYDENLGPYIFEGYAEVTAQRAAAIAPQDVLELAAGTGIVTRKLRDQLPASTRLTATDLNEPMLAIAQSKFASGENVEFRQADACALPFAGDTFDAVVCQFGVMFFPDKPGSFHEVARVLRPGGSYIFNVWNAFSENPFARIAHETIASFFTADPPAFYQVPFGYHDASVIEAALRSAAFRGVWVDKIDLSAGVPVARHFAEGLVYGNPVGAEIAARGSASLETVVDAITAALNRELGDDPLRMPLSALVFTAQR